MFAVKIQSFPNRELRATLYKVPLPREKPETEEDDSLVIKSKVETELKEPKQLEFSDKKAGYGKLGRQSKFSTYARRTMLRAGAVFDLSCPKEECLFLTGTLPGSTDESFRAIAEWSSWIVHRLKAWIAKRVDAKFDMYCWEWQKRGALHLHYVVHVPCRRHRRYIRKAFRREWIRLLDGVGRLSGVDLYRKTKNFTHRHNKKVVRATAEVVKKSVASYMAKYLSKNANNMKGFQSRRRYFPARWYGCSRPLLARLRELTEEEVLYFPKRQIAENQFSEITSVLETTCTYSYTYKARESYGSVAIAFHSVQDWGSVETHGLLNWILVRRKMNNSYSMRPLSDQIFEKVYDYLWKAKYSEAVATLLSTYGNPWHLDLRRMPSVVALTSDQQVQIAECLYQTFLKFEACGQKLSVEQLQIKRFYEPLRKEFDIARIMQVWLAPEPELSPQDYYKQLDLMEVAACRAEQERDRKRALRYRALQHPKKPA